MRGFFEHSLKEDFNASLGFFDNVLEVLEWGRRFWPDEPKENRGAVFQKTFLRGVRCLRLETLVKVHYLQLLLCFSDRNAVRQATMAFPAKYPLNDLYEAARELLEDVEGDEASTEERNDPAHFSSFYVYPRGQAKSCALLLFMCVRLAYSQPQCHGMILSRNGKAAQKGSGHDVVRLSRTIR